mgnify:CR=1 FL=1
MGDFSAAFYGFSIGKWRATVVSDGWLKLPPAETVFPNCDPETARDLLERDLLPTDCLLLQENALLVEIQDKLVLFDGGMGHRTIFGTNSGRLLPTLRAAGYAPEQVDMVCITHPHTDHVWGLTDAEGRRNFPNAEICLSRLDHDYWTDLSHIGENPREIFKLAIEGAKSNLDAYGNRLRLLDDGEEICPGLTTVATPGHTFGHISFLISSENEQLMVIGDSLHHAMQFRHPEWEYWGDSDRDLAVRSRRMMMETAEAGNIRILGYHLPYPGLGRVRREGEGFVFVPEQMHLD